MNRIFAAAVTKTCMRQLTTSSVRFAKPDLSKLKKKQALFQVDNDVPVHLKGGPSDVILFYSTVVLTFAGFAGALSSIYKLITKGK